METGGSCLGWRSLAARGFMAETTNEQHKHLKQKQTCPRQKRGNLSHRFLAAEVSGRRLLMASRCISFFTKREPHFREDLRGL